MAYYKNGFLMRRWGQFCALASIVADASMRASRTSEATRTAQRSSGTQEDVQPRRNQA